MTGHTQKFSKYIYTVGWLLFFLYLCDFCVQLISYHYQLIIYPYPLEVREGAMLVTTNLLLQNINPYNLEQMPLATNVYGIFYHLIVYPLAQLWGPTFMVHRAVSGSAIILSCGLIALFLRKHNVRWIYSFAAALLLYALWLFHSTPIAKPDALGGLFFLLSVFLPVLLRYTSFSLVLSIVFGIFAFYTKPYFLFGILCVGSYVFLFVSKQKGFYYSVSAFLLGVLSALIVNSISNVYFLNVFFIHKNEYSYSFDYTNWQFMLFLTVHAGLIAIILMYFLLNTQSLYKKYRKTCINFCDFRKPLVDFPIAFSVYGLALSVLLVYFILGTHRGNFMVYHFQLVSPFMIVSALSSSRPDFKEYTLPAKYHKYITFVTVVFLFVALSSTYRFLHHDFLSADFLDGYSPKVYSYESQEWKDSWKEVEQIASPYQDILNSAMFVFPQLSMKKEIYDSGQTQYFQACVYPEILPLTTLFPSNEDLKTRWESYVEDIQTSIEHQEFDAIVLWNNATSLSPMETIKKYYIHTYSKPLYLFQTSEYYALDVWLPKKIPDGT